MWSAELSNRHIAFFWINYLRRATTSAGTEWTSDKEISLFRIFMKCLFMISDILRRIDGRATPWASLSNWKNTLWSEHLRIPSSREITLSVILVLLNRCSTYSLIRIQNLSIILKLYLLRRSSQALSLYSNSSCWTSLIFLVMSSEELPPSQASMITR